MSPISALRSTASPDTHPYADAPLLYLPSTCLAWGLRQVRVFFGDEEYEKAKTMEQCLALLSKKSEDDNTPFLQVFNLWRRHDNLRPFCLAKRCGTVTA